MIIRYYYIMNELTFYVNSFFVYCSRW